MGHHTRLGQDGEQAAVAHLERLRWRVLDRNWRPRDRAMRGELDIVATDRDTVVVCEVKTRSGPGAGEPAAGVTPRKLAQLRQLTAAWLAEHPAQRAQQVRIDVLGVLWPPHALAPSIDHRRDVGR